MRDILLTLLLAATPAAAQTQAQMNADAGRAFTRANAAMTRAWRSTFAYMKGRDAQDTSRGGGFGYAAALLASQRAWLRYRDTQCVMAGGEFAGGSLQGMAMGQCKTRLSDARAQELRGLRWAR